MDGFDNLNISFYLQAMGLHSFPGSAIKAALPSGMSSKMGSFQWKFVEYKGQNGFVIVNFSRRRRLQHRRYRLEQGSQEMRDILGSGRVARQERGIQTKQGDRESQVGC